MNCWKIRRSFYELLLFKIIYDKSLIDTVVLLVQSSVNQSNLTEPIVYPNHCGGVSSYTRWAYYSPTGIYMQINTSNCNFNITPLYYTSIIGDRLQNDLTGCRAIYFPSQYGFRIYCRLQRLVRNTDVELLSD